VRREVIVERIKLAGIAEIRCHRDVYSSEDLIRIGADLPTGNLDNLEAALDRIDHAGRDTESAESDELEAAS
jgi:hypothetical protein